MQRQRIMTAHSIIAAMAKSTAQHGQEDPFEELLLGRILSQVGHWLLLVGKRLLLRVHGHEFKGPNSLDLLVFYIILTGIEFALFLRQIPNHTRGK